MHDGGILNIEVMPLAPITNPVEMNETMNNVVSKYLLVLSTNNYLLKLLEMI